LTVPDALYHMLREASLLADAAASACLGRAVAWHGIWMAALHGPRGAGVQWRGRSVQSIYDAHEQLASQANSPLQHLSYQGWFLFGNTHLSLSVEHLLTKCP
jgi:hypothetical protein